MSDLVQNQSGGAVILIVDDTPANLDLLTSVLEPQGYQVLAAPSGEVALRVAQRAAPDLILLDILMPGLDGYDTCRQLKASEATRSTPVIFISARDEVQGVVSAFRAGGVDYISKPFEAEEVLVRVETQLRLSGLTRELLRKNSELEQRTAELSTANRRLHDEFTRRRSAEDALQDAKVELSSLSDSEAEHWGISGIVGKSRTIGPILDDIRRLRNFGAVNVVITGESGTGKELIARAIHFGSSRAKHPFIAVNCVAIPEELAESMLFGHVRGAFTGATMDRRGYFEMAHAGTLFLDEIGDMPRALQAKLLRVLEDGRVTPLGASKEKTVDVRIVAATNADLPARIANGSFREDLYFRLAQFTVQVPPLRERRDDIPILAEHFANLFAETMGIAPPAVSPAALRVLAGHPFPGNIRELKNVIDRGLIESGGKDLHPQHLFLIATPGAAGRSAAPPTDAGTSSPLDTTDLPLNLEAAENLLIRRALAETNGNIAAAARRLGVNRTRIYRRLGEGADGAE